MLTRFLSLNQTTNYNYSIKKYSLTCDVIEKYQGVLGPSLRTTYKVKKHNLTNLTRAEEVKEKLKNTY